jgi:pimeloyl-ACP methyl ester carboxylesterase
LTPRNARELPAPIVGPRGLARFVQSAGCMSSQTSSPRAVPASSDTEWFLSHERRLADAGSARIAYRRIGSGPPLLMIHGWPFSSLSFRKLARRLSERFTCVLPDTPGLGDTEWDATTDFRFAAQADRLRIFAAQVGLQRYSILAHDTGATIGRQLALIDPDRVDKRVLLNTEIPGHRPPWIPLFQRTTVLPGSAVAFKLLLRSAAFRRSSMGYGGCFSDPHLLDEDDFLACFVKPLLGAPRRMEGVVKYLGGIDWALVDGLARRHAEIEAPVLLVWGADDPTFPVARARAMVGQLRNGRGICEIARAKLLVHEERPAEVAAAALPFLESPALPRPAVS